MLLSRRKDKESGIVYSGALHSDEKAQTTATPAWINMKHIKSQKTPSVGSFSSDICEMGSWQGGRRDSCYQGTAKESQGV